MEHMAILKQMGLFKGLDTLEFVQVSKLVKHKRFGAGERVMKEGDPGSSLFIVKAGKFRAYLDHGGHQHDLTLFGQGESFGELALIDYGPRSASIECLAGGELLECDAKDLQTLMGHSEALKIKLLQNLVTDLAEKLRKTDDRLAKLL